MAPEIGSFTLELPGKLYTLPTPKNEVMYSSQSAGLSVCLSAELLEGSERILGNFLEGFDNMISQGPSDDLHQDPEIKRLGGDLWFVPSRPAAEL